eukprot:scaffold4026_cov117-Cylindrotheca_fusiformis.AAC.40
MPKKKTNYDNIGFARKLSGRIFGKRASSRKSESEWRPRKAKFERLEADDVYDPEAITSTYSFSVESETGEYKRDLMTKRKRVGTQKARKPDFAGIAIQPSQRDKNTGSAKKKKQKTDALGFPLSSDASVDFSIDSRQSASTKQTASQYSVMSDPTNFFSHKPATLTKSNLEMLTSASAESGPNHFCDGIENYNPRSKFHQFTIDEDKESTVILPVGFSGEDDTSEFDDEVDSTNCTSPKEANMIFGQEARCSISNRFTSIDPSFALPGKEKGKRLSGHRVNTELSARHMSAASLCYSPSPKSKETMRRSGGEEMGELRGFSTTPEIKRNRDVNGMHAQTQPRPIRDGRFPLSPLNGTRAPSSTGKTSAFKSNDAFVGLGSWSDFVNGSSSSDRFEPANENDDPFLNEVRPHMPQNNGRAQWGTSKPLPTTQLYGFSKENKPMNSFDSEDSDDAFRPRIEDERPIGIQSFEGASRDSSAGLSIGSGSNGKLLYTHGRSAIAASSFDDDCSIGCSVGKSSSVGSVAKPSGLPSNAIVASMLFQRHHSVDTRAVEAKLRAKREENTKMEAIRGDVPRAIQAQDDMYSCISSFSDDTGIEPWKKPTRDLLQHFANSRRTEFDTGRYRREQRAQVETLFEA